MFCIAWEDMDESSFTHDSYNEGITHFMSHGTQS